MARILQFYRRARSGEWLAEKLAGLAAAIGGDGQMLRAIELFVRTAADEALVRINPVRFAQQHGFAAEAVASRSGQNYLGGLAWVPGFRPAGSTRATPLPRTHRMAAAQSAR